MGIKYFTCPDSVKIEVENCLKEGNCRMGDRCATRSYLRLAASDRPWTGRPSCTQLIQGTMQAFLKLTKEYGVCPDARAFMILGTTSHAKLETAEDEYSELEVKFRESDITGIADVIETESGKAILTDYKTAGSYKIAKALGFTTVAEDTGEVYKSGKRKGEPKMRKVLVRRKEFEDRDDWEKQLNFYRIQYEKMTGKKIDELRIQCIVRDGGLWIAKSRGVFRRIYYFKINILPDGEILDYFAQKKKALEMALSAGKWTQWCSQEECWEGIKCKGYCEVAEFCGLGQMYMEQKKEEDMPIKGVSDIKRLPRLGKIRLGVKMKKVDGVAVEAAKDELKGTYPKELDYFRFDPQIPTELERKRILAEIEKKYGKEPKEINIMFPLPDLDAVFPQWFKRYGTTTSLQCKGDGDTAEVTQEEFAKELKIINRTEEGRIKVKCLGAECPYVKSKKCSMTATLQVLLPEIPGAGVWQITTGSFNSIVNLNSCFDYIRAVCGRVHMIPLKLQRRAETIAHEGQKRTHYILNINMDIALADLQKYAQIKPEEIMLELPAPETDKEDIVFLENVDINTDQGNGKKTETEDPPARPAAQPEEEKSQVHRDIEKNSDKNTGKASNDPAYMKSTELATGYSEELQKATSMQEINMVLKAINVSRDALMQEHKEWLKNEEETAKKRVKTL